MMLINRFIGSSLDKLSNNVWELIEDNYGNTIAQNSAIKQRIKYGKNVQKTFEKLSDTEYDFPNMTFISNNNKNMNLSLMNFFSKDKEVRNAHVDDSIIYVTLSSEDYKLIKYETDYEIVQTYKKKDLYVGCAVKFPKNAGDLLIRIYAKDLNENKFVEICIDSENKVYITEINDKYLFKEIQSAFKRNSRKMIGFKMKFNPNKFVTNTYIIDKRLHEYISNRISESEDYTIICLNGSNDLSDELSDEEKQEIDSIMKEHIVDKRIRALTTVGIKLPYNFYKKYNIITHFEFTEDDENNVVLNCIRSN